MKTILTTAYALNPYKGSEDGTAWNLVGQIARYNKVIVITRKNNAPSIKKYLIDNKDLIQNSNAQFFYFDLPYWMRFWKKGERGAMLYFYLWQLFMPLFIYRSGLKFDIAHNLNFHNDWTPTFLWVHGKPLVWGPIGHHPRIPDEYLLKPYGRKEQIKGKVLWLVKNIFWKLDPFLAIALKKSDRILCINSAVEKIHAIQSSKAVRMPAVGSVYCKQNQPIPTSGKFIILSVGRLVPMKGFDITIRAFHKFYQNLSDHQKTKVELRIVGKGPLYDSIESDISRFGLENSVVLCKWVEKEKMDEIYKNASVFFFPSHEGAGMVVPEALSHGLPVVCFDNEGPGEFIDSSCGAKVPYGSYDQSVSEFASILSVLFENKKYYSDLSKGAFEKFEACFDWNVRGETLRNIYATLD